MHFIEFYFHISKTLLHFHCYQHYANNTVYYLLITKYDESSDYSVSLCGLICNDYQKSLENLSQTKKHDH